MTTYRILYIEHDRSRDDYMSAMQQAGATVDPIDYLDKEQLLREVDLKLHRGRYDAVITDAFFLRQGCDHEDDDTRGDYLLPELVSCVRTIDNRRTRIVVMTHFPDPVLQDNTEALGVDDIWDKYSCPVDFVRWKVARMAQDAARHLPEHALLAAIADVVHKQEHPTANDKVMLDMIDRYQSRVGEREQILAIRPCIEAIANGLGKDMTQAIHSLFGTLIEMEPVNVAGSPSSWGHLRHVVNVWWLGWYFIRSGWIDGKWIAERAFPEKARKADMEAIQLVENSWFVAAMFHDIGKLYEDMPKLVKDCNTFLSVYPVQCTLPDLQAKIDDTAIKRFVTTLATAARCQQLVGIFTALQADTAAAVSDHGVLSAYTIYSRLSGKGMPEEALLAAAVAVATHNWIKKTAKLEWEKGQETDTKVPLAVSPLAGLLVLCDQLQVWDRQTGLENIRQTPGIECTELRQLAFENGTMDMLIDYLSFRYLAPMDVKTEEIREKLKDILTSSVIPVLNKVEMPTERGKIRVRFVHDGRQEVRPEWMAP